MAFSSECFRVPFPGCCTGMTMPWKETILMGVEGGEFGKDRSYECPSSIETHLVWRQQTDVDPCFIFSCKDRRALLGAVDI